METAMSACITCRAAPQPRASLSYKATTVFAVTTAMTFAASGAAPTTLYQRYQEVFGLTPFVLTIIFGAYVLSLLGALLTVGSFSDYIGRRPAILGALALNVAAMVMFIAADSAATLIVARALQGFATGLATATLGAVILDTDRSRGPVLNTITAFIGLTAGSLGAVRWSPTRPIRSNSCLPSCSPCRPLKRSPSGICRRLSRGSPARSPRFSLMSASPPKRSARSCR
jgi:hypothetical protein